MVNLSTNQQLRIILPNTNKALAEVIKDASPKELDALSQQKDLKSILNSLLKQTAQNTNSNQTLLNLLKNNPTFKNLGSLSSNLKDLLSTIKSETPSSPLEDKLKSFLTHIKDVDKNVLKQNINNSGIFLESKLKNALPMKEILQNDLKAILLQASEKLQKSDTPNKAEILKQLDKLTMQIDYNQLVSHLSNASSLYVPFAWDEMKEGQIEIKKDKEKNFFVDIHLQLKEYGTLDLKLMLYEENQLNIKLYTKNQELKDALRTNITDLRSSLIEAGITLRDIQLLTPKEENESSAYESLTDKIDLGFEIIT